MTPFERLIDEMVKKAKGQTPLGRLLGVGQSTVSRWATKGSEPQASELLKILQLAHRFGIEPGALFGLSLASPEGARSDTPAWPRNARTSEWIPELHRLLVAAFAHEGIQEEQAAALSDVAIELFVGQLARIAIGVQGETPRSPPELPVQAPSDQPRSQTRKRPSRT